MLHVSRGVPRGRPADGLPDQRRISMSSVGRPRRITEHMRTRRCLAMACVVTLLVVPVFAGTSGGTAPDLRLLDAVARQDAKAVRALLKEGVEVNASRADGVSPLLWAA